MFIATLDQQDVVEIGIFLGCLGGLCAVEGFGCSVVWGLRFARVLASRPHAFGVEDDPSQVRASGVSLRCLQTGAYVISALAVK